MDDGIVDNGGRRGTDDDDDDIFALGLLVHRLIKDCGISHTALKAIQHRNM